MLAAGIGLILLGYAFLYSGASNLYTSGKGIGFLKAVSGKDLGKGTGSATGALFNNITPQGNSGAAQPVANQSPVSGVQQI